MIKRLSILAAAALVLVGAYALKESEKRAPGPEGNPAPSGQVEAALPRLVDLGSDTCIPCKKMAPILEELSVEYRDLFLVEVLDVRKNPELGRQWGIRVIPTQIFIDANGEERFRHEGFLGKEAILSKWSELGLDLTARASGTGKGS